MQFYIVLSLIFGILITLFALFNAAVVDVNFFFAEVQTPLALVIIASALIGAITMLVFDTFRRIKSGKNLKEVTKKVNGFEKEMAIKDESIQKLEDTLKQKEQILNSQVEIIDALKKNQQVTAEKIENNYDDDNYNDNDNDETVI